MEPAVTNSTIDQMLSHWGISESVEGDTWRLHVPPPKLAELHRGYRTCIPFLAIGGIGAVVLARALYRHDSESLGNGLVMVIEFGLTGLIILAFAVERLTRRIYFAITASDLQVTRITSRKALVMVHWPRKQVHEIHVNRVNGKLHISTDDENPFEIYLTSHRELNEWIATRLNNTLQRAGVPLAGHLPNPGSTLSYASVIRPEEPNGRRRKKLIAATVGLVFVGVGMLFTSAWPFAFISLFIASYPAGIALGTQKKDFWI